VAHCLRCVSCYRSRCRRQFVAATDTNVTTRHVSEGSQVRNVSEGLRGLLRFVGLSCDDECFGELDGSANSGYFGNSDAGLNGLSRTIFWGTQPLRFTGSGQCHPADPKCET
jgi:hypothetical protein